jgi:glycosyltransferase involved in cell wall biosynthesis
MELTALVDSPDHVCCRYRLAAFADDLAAIGHNLKLMSLPKNWWARLELFRSLRGRSVILQRRLLPIWQVAYLRHCASHLIFDFDDAVFLRDSYARRGLHDRVRLRRFIATAKACDAVVAGNRYLKSKTLELAGRSAVCEIPTCIDLRPYPVARTGQGREGARLVWVGSSSTLRGLEQCRHLLEGIGAGVPGASLQLICDRSLTLQRLPVEFSPWSETTEARDIATGDVGVSWMPDDDWSRGKCGLKVLQYMAAGLPVVANPVGVHIEMVRHGETGFLAETPSDWVAAVRRLKENVELRTRMGQAGRRLVEASYSVGVGVQRWSSLLQNLDPSGKRVA